MVISVHQLNCGEDMPIINEIIAQLPSDPIPIRKIVIGVHWTLVCSKYAGLASTLVNCGPHGHSHMRDVGSLLRKSVQELIGIAQPDPITDFMDLAPSHTVSTLDKDLCVNCGNCTRCPYLAITLDDEKYPVIDKDKCVGCSLCVKKCFTGALSMGPRQ